MSTMDTALGASGFIVENKNYFRFSLFHNDREDSPTPELHVPFYEG